MLSQIKDILSILIAIFSMGFISVLFIFVYNYTIVKRRQFMIIHFAEYLVSLEYFQEKAYEIIHKDRILIYSAEGIRLNDDEVQTISIDYANLVFKLMGDTVKNEIISLYGLESLSLNMMSYFNNRYEEDEIRKNTVESLMDRDSIMDEDNKL